MRRIAVIGQGKLGRSVQSDRYDILPVLRDQAIPQADIVVVATPGAEFLNLIPALLDVNAPVIIASTGFKWPDIQPKTPWIYGRNFSLMVQALRASLQTFGHVLQDDAAIAMTEIHHADKKDAPSGTAVLLREFMGRDMPIESRREGTALPHHTITVSTPLETVAFSHTAQSRETYGRGIIWLIDRLMDGYRPAPGLLSFEDAFDAITAL